MSNQKNPAVAAILGLLFGRFGLFYVSVGQGIAALAVLIVGSSPKGWNDSVKAPGEISGAPSDPTATPAQACSGGTCVRCEAALAADDRFCPECGMRVPEDSDETPLFCVDCGCEEIHEGDRFCPGCGGPL